MTAVLPIITGMSGCPVDFACSMTQQPCAASSYCRETRCCWACWCAEMDKAGQGQAGAGVGQDRDGHRHGWNRDSAGRAGMGQGEATGRGRVGPGGGLLAWQTVAGALCEVLLFLNLISN